MRDEAPKDRNFLGHVVVFHWNSDAVQHVKVGMKWVECLWYEGNYFGKPCYMEFDGDKCVLTSRAVVEDWRELPLPTTPKDKE
jgi:hypothetical protein